MTTDFGIFGFAQVCNECYRDVSRSLIRVDDGLANFHFHLVLFRTAFFLPGEGPRMVAVVAWIMPIERRVINLLPYPSFP